MLSRGFCVGTLCCFETLGGSRPSWGHVCEFCDSLLRTWSLRKVAAPSTHAHINQCSEGKDAATKDCFQSCFMIIVKHFCLHSNAKSLGTPSKAASCRFEYWRHARYIVWQHSSTTPWPKKMMRTCLKWTCLILFPKRPQRLEKRSSSYMRGKRQCLSLVLALLVSSLLCVSFLDTCLNHKALTPVFRLNSHVKPPSAWPKRYNSRTPAIF